MHVPDDCLVMQDAVVEDISMILGFAEGEVLRIARTQELQGHLHDLFATQFAAWKVVEDHIAIGAKQMLTLLDALNVGLLDFQPPVGLQPIQGHRLVISPSQWTVRPRQGSVEVEVLIWFG